MLPHTDGTGQHFCSTARPKLTRNHSWFMLNHNLFSGPDQPVIYISSKAK